ncbi:MAG TPA: biotin-dependent carboxyltransferase family protein, partial [Acidimicrobiales bacterium]|nr:biotin-dependent carboxyltransferase family protein [Acidimicrobiales bacterium]
CTLSGPTLRFRDRAVVALAGAGAPARIDGATVARWPAPVEPGSVLDVGRCDGGLRTYLAVAGGWVTDPVLGSCSTDTLSGLGPPAVRSGDVLGFGRPDGPGAPPSTRRPEVGPDGRADAGDEIRVRVVPGPRRSWLEGDDWPGTGGRDGGGLVVSPVSDRTGVRLTGRPVPIGRRPPLPSEGMVEGAVQVPPDGQPIVLLANHATTGGYPAVAVVVDADLPRLAQARPGTRVVFEWA